MKIFKNTHTGEMITAKRIVFFINDKWEIFVSQCYVTLTVADGWYEVK